VGHELEGVQPDLGRLLDDGPRRLLALVPLVGRGADDAVGEVVDPLLDLQLVLVELEGELGHRAPRRIIEDSWLPLSNLARVPSPDITQGERQRRGASGRAQARTTASPRRAAPAR